MTVARFCYNCLFLVLSILLCQVFFHCVEVSETLTEEPASCIKLVNGNYVLWSPTSIFYKHATSEKKIPLKLHVPSENFMIEAVVPLDPSIFIFLLQCYDNTNYLSITSRQKDVYNCFKVSDKILSIAFFNADLFIALRNSTGEISISWANVIIDTTTKKCDIVVNARKPASLETSTGNYLSIFSRYNKGARPENTNTAFDEKSTKTETKWFRVDYTPSINIISLRNGSLDGTVFIPRPETIGTHDGTFHSDDALAVAMAMLLPKYAGATILRSRSNNVLSRATLIVDVGAVCDPQGNKFDHHQAGFAETFNEKYKTPLSSAGLFFKYHGLQIVDIVLRDQYGLQADQKTLGQIHEALYRLYIEEIDAIDNGYFPPAEIPVAVLEKIIQVSQEHATTEEQINALVIKAVKEITLLPMIAREPLATHLSGMSDISAKIRTLDTTCRHPSQKDEYFLEAVKIMEEYFRESVKLAHDYVVDRSKFYKLITRPVSIPVVPLTSRTFCAPFINGPCFYGARKEILVLMDPDRTVFEPFMDLVDEFKDVKIIITNMGQSWRIRCRPLSEGNFRTHVRFPENISGVRSTEEYFQLTNLDDITFIHSSGSFAFVSIFDSAIKLSKLTLAAE